MIFPAEKEIFFREVSGKLYNSYVYFFTRYLAELPGLILPSVISCAILFHLLGLSEEPTALFIYFAANCLLSFAGGNMGLLIGLGFSSTQTAVGLLPLIMIPIMLFGGLLQKLSLIPGYASWFQYLSPAKYALSAIILSQFEGKSSFIATPFGPVEVDWKETTGLNGTATENLLYLAILALGLGVAALVLLIIKQRAI